MNGHYILEGREVKPVDLMTWARWMEGHLNGRHVGNDLIGDVRVSTVFLGLDHSFGEGPPLLFETMVFGGEHDGWQDRYTTWEQALAGHSSVLSAIREGHAPDATESGVG